MSDDDLREEYIHRKAASIRYDAENMTSWEAELSWLVNMVFDVEHKTRQELEDMLFRLDVMENDDAP